MTTSKIIFALASAAVAFFASTAAFAHAQLISSQPAANSMSAQAPAEIALHFNEKIESAFASIRVSDASGQQVDRKDTQIDKTDPKVLRVSVPPLKAGSYKVQWRATAADLHKIEGTFTFRIGN